MTSELKHDCLHGQDIHREWGVGQEENTLQNKFIFSD